MKVSIGNAVYVKKENSKFTRYIYLDSYEKEKDVVYTNHNGINLNEDNVIDLNDLVDKPIIYNDNDNDNNDFKAHIIFKSLKIIKLKQIHLLY